MRIRLRGLRAITVAALFGCDSSAPVEQPPVDIRDAVTGEAATALDAEGRFVLTPPPPRQVGIPSLASPEALVLANAYLAQAWSAVGGGLSSAFIQGHGAPLTLGELHACGEARFAESPMAPFPLEWDYAARRSFGEYWVFRYCTATEATAGYVAVSPYATDLRLEGGQVVFPLIAGGEFQANGVPAIWDEAVVYSPENAVKLAYQCTGSRIREVPRLVQQYGGVASFSKWMLVLERRVRVATSHGIITVDTVFAGRSVIRIGQSTRLETGLVVAAPDQASSIPIVIHADLPPPEGPIPPEPFEFITVQAERNPAFPLTFDVVRCGW